MVIFVYTYSFNVWLSTSFTSSFLPFSTRYYRSIQEEPKYYSYYEKPYTSQIVHSDVDNDDQKPANDAKNANQKPVNDPTNYFAGVNNLSHSSIYAPRPFDRYKWFPHELRHRFSDLTGWKWFYLNRNYLAMKYLHGKKDRSSSNATTDNRRSATENRGPTSDNRGPTTDNQGGWVNDQLTRLLSLTSNDACRSEIADGVCGGKSPDNIVQWEEGYKEIGQTIKIRKTKSFEQEK